MVRMGPGHSSRQHFRSDPSNHKPPNHQTVRGGGRGFTLSSRRFAEGDGLRRLDSFGAESVASSVVDPEDMDHSCHFIDVEDDAV